MGKYEQLIYNHLHLSHTLDELQQIFKCGLACYEGQLADAEIAQLQREKAELEEALKFNNETIDELNKKYLFLDGEHNALVERVKVHNKQFEDGIALYEGRPELQFVQALLSKNLISLD